MMRASLDILVDLMRSEGLIGAQVSLDPPTVVEELRQFTRHLNDVCGLAQSTIDVRLLRVRSFLLDRFPRGPIRLNSLTRVNIAQFMSHYTANCTPISRQVIGGSIRSYLRFKALSGENIASLCGALPKAACWRLSSLPKSISSREIAQLLDAFDRQRPW